MKPIDLFNIQSGLTVKFKVDRIRAVAYLIRRSQVILFIMECNRPKGKRSWRKKEKAKNRKKEKAKNLDTSGYESITLSEKMPVTATASEIKLPHAEEEKVTVASDHVHSATETKGSSKDQVHRDTMTQNPGIKIMQSVYTSSESYMYGPAPCKFVPVTESALWCTHRSWIA